LPTSKIPEPTVLRLSIYLRCLKQVAAEDIRTISSSGIEKRTGFSAGQVRKDLSYFGEFGKSGLGYSVKPLISRLSEIMGLTDERKIVIVGAGNLGTALAGYQSFRSAPFNLVSIFDNDKTKIGKKLWNVEIKDAAKISELIGNEGVQIGIIATSADSAQEVADKLIDAGICAILNFAPTRLLVPDKVIVRNVDLTKELEALCFYLPFSQKS